MKRPPAKKVSASAIQEQREQVFPHHLNPAGILFGGEIAVWGDKVAALCAMQHCGMPVVTVVQEVRHEEAVKLGEWLLFKASVNRVWRSSCEVGIKVFAENLFTQELRHVATGYFVMATTKRTTSGARKWMPEVLPETTEEKKRFCEAALRNNRRKREEKKRKEKRNNHQETA